MNLFEPRNANNISSELDLFLRQQTRDRRTDTETLSILVRSMEGIVSMAIDQGGRDYYDDCEGRIREAYNEGREDAEDEGRDEVTSLKEEIEELKGEIEELKEASNE